MVTFTFGDRRARMYLEYDPMGSQAGLRWGNGPGGYRNISSGEDAIHFLAEKWRCEQDQIKHDLPSQINIPEQELDFAMFYNGHPMAIRVPGAMDKLVWCGWNFRFDDKMDRGVHEPTWRDVITKVEFEARSEYYAAALKRIMDGNDQVCCRPSGWKMEDRNGRSYVHIDVWSNPLVAFKVAEGEMQDGVFRVRRLTEEKLKVRIPFPQDATRAMKIVNEEKTKAIKRELEKLFSEKTLLGGGSVGPHGDVAIVDNYPDSILHGAELPQGYDFFHFRNSSAWIVRIPSSGQIRCPEYWRGHLIGHGGGKIKALAQKHGHRYLKVV